MASIEDELLLDEQENQRELEFIRSQLPTEARGHLSDEDILYMMDVIVDYYFSSGILESDDEEVEIDLEAVSQHVCKEAEKDGQGTFDPQEVFFVVQADLDFLEQNV